MEGHILLCKNTDSNKRFYEHDITEVLEFLIEYIFISNLHPYVFQEVFEDTKGVIRIRKSKDRQHNDKKKKNK